MVKKKLYLDFLQKFHANLSRSLFLNLFLPAMLWATNDSPWIDEIYIPILSVEGAYQYIPTFSTKDCHLHRSENDGFGKFGIYYAHSEAFSLEGEVFFTCTHRHPWAIDHVKETVKIVFSDDVAGDCMASSGGISLYQVPSVALYDPAWINQAHFSAALFLSLGKEWAKAPYWEERVYGLLACGYGDYGAPWINGKLAVCKNILDIHRFNCFIEGVYGLGSRSLKERDFRGYGNVCYRIIDGTLEYQYLISDLGFIGVKGVYRLFSYNAPKNSWVVALEWSQPFSL